MPKLSVIVPIYNVEKFLARCLDSILAQTLSDIEIICVDDGSPDNSIEILRKYSSIDKRITVIRQKNKGLGGARNTGIDAATGEYLGFVDSDDYLDSDFFEKLYNTAKRHDADIAVTGIVKHRKRSSKLYISFEEAVTYTTLNDKFSVCNCPPYFHVVNKIYRRSLFAGNHIRFKEHVYFEDIEFTSNMLLNSNTIVTVPGTFYRYIYNGESILKGRQTPKKQQDKYMNRKWFDSFTIKHGIAVPKSYRNIPVKTYTFFGLCVLKIKEMDNIRVWRIFDVLPIWWKRCTTI